MGKLILLTLFLFKTAAYAEDFVISGGQYESAKFNTSANQNSYVNSKEVLINVPVTDTFSVELQSFKRTYGKALTGNAAKLDFDTDINTQVGIPSVLPSTVTSALDDLGIPSNVLPGQVMVNGKVTGQFDVNLLAEFEIKEKGNIAIFKKQIPNSNFSVKFGMEKRQADMFIGVRSLSVTCKQLNAVLSANVSNLKIPVPSNFIQDVGCSDELSNEVNAQVKDLVYQKNEKRVVLETYAILGIGYSHPDGHEFELIIKPTIDNQNKAENESDLPIPIAYFRTQGSDLPFSVRGKYEGEYIGLSASAYGKTFNGNYCEGGGEVALRASIKNVSVAVEHGVSGHIAFMKNKTSLPIKFKLGDDRINITPEVENYEVMHLSLDPLNDCFVGATPLGSSDICAELSFNNEEADQEVFSSRGLVLGFDRNVSSPDKNWGGETRISDEGRPTRVAAYKRFNAKTKLAFEVNRDELGNKNAIINFETNFR